MDSEPYTVPSVYTAGINSGVIPQILLYWLTKGIYGVKVRPIWHTCRNYHLTAVGNMVMRIDQER